MKTIKRLSLSEQVVRSIVRYVQENNLQPGDKLPSERDMSSMLQTSRNSVREALRILEDRGLIYVKTGSGAFMKTVEDSRKLAEKMVSIGTMAGRKCCAVITNMDIPLGHAIGNSLEVMEAIETLKGNGPADLTAVCLELAANMLYMAGKGSLEECRKLAEGAMADGSALDALANMVKGQHGDESYIYHPEKFPRSALSKEVKAEKDGYVCHMDTESIGIASVCLGAGRSRKDDVIDYKAGIILKKKYGEPVKAGETLAVLYADDEKLVVVNTPPCEVIRVSLTPGHEKMSAKVCYEIGNRHAPLFWGENDTFITIYNEPMLVMLQKIHGVQAEKEVLKLDFDRRISASIHNHHH